MEENIKIKGFVKVQLIDEHGDVKQSHEDHNVITTVGKSYLAEWLQASSQSSNFMRYIAVGTGTNAAASSDTTLQTELTTRGEGSLSNASNVWTNTVTFGAGVNTGAITEAGLFSASSSGTMMARQVFSAYNKAAGDSLIVTWNISLS